MRRPFFRVVAAVGSGLLAATLLAGCSLELVAEEHGGDQGAGFVPAPSAPPLPELPKQLDLSKENRREALPGLPDWSRAGYREGAGLPTDKEITDDDRCVVTATELRDEYGVRAGDRKDDTTGLQKAIDAVKKSCSPKASYDELSLLTLPAGEVDVSRQIAVDADYLVIRGGGADPAKGTRVVFRPDENTRYDALTKNGGDWDEDATRYKSGKGGWLWPGRGLFRVQSREVEESYRDDYESAPANRKDLFEGTVNVHWKAGAELADKPGDKGYAARAGDTVVQLGDKPDTDAFEVGGYVNVRAANTTKFYEQQQALPTDFELQNLHMRQQIFRVNAVDEDARTITVDKPLEFDVSVDSTSDGSAEIDGQVYESKAAPLVDPVLGVGFENLHISQAVRGLDAADARHDYANLSPADEMHGIVFKWAADCWVRGIATYLTGSHPIVTEEAKNLQIQGNSFDGAWNKGAGGNGYLRGSRVWDSVYAGNVLRNLRHFTFQWSASGNVFVGNDTDADVNLHGGWERHNLVELNTVRVPYEHRPGNCSKNCGGEGGEVDDDQTAWYPIWWGAGKKAVKWSGATGPQNVFYANTMSKQERKGGPYVPYYAGRHTIHQFGWDGDGYQHLGKGGEPIDDWAGNERDDYQGNGVDSTRTDDHTSLFLVKAQ